MFNRYVTKEEFYHPELIDYRIVWAITRAREDIGVPFRFSKTAQGNVIHPWGDAVPADHPSHASRSLHKAGIPGQNKALALDFDSYSDSLGESWAFFEKLIDMKDDKGDILFRGLGIYPEWNTKGYHADVRPANHFTLTEEDRKIWVWNKSGYHAAPTFKDRQRLLRPYLQ